jgi:transcriptional regulator with XRE-family HTH domain
MTQERLAYATGLSLSTVRKIETGEVVEPGFFPVMAILAVLDIEPSQLDLPVVKRAKATPQGRQGR